MQLRRFATLGLVAAAGLISTLSAQIDTGTITGRVTDPAGAAIPGVQVSLVQTETNFRFSAVTNAEGIYRVQSLQPGTYRITFEATGFKRGVHEAVELRVGDVRPVDASMEVGTLTESVEVKAQGVLLETETSGTGTVTEGGTLYKQELYQH